MMDDTTYIYIYDVPHLISFHSTFGIYIACERVKLKQEEDNLLNDSNKWDIYVEVLSEGHDWFILWKDEFISAAIIIISFFEFRYVFPSFSLKYVCIGSTVSIYNIGMYEWNESVDMSEYGGEG